MTPVALRIQVSEKEGFLQAKPDRSDRAGDLALHEGFAARRSLMIEQDAVRCVKSVGFPVVHRYPIGIEFGRCVWRARVKGKRVSSRFAESRGPRQQFTILTSRLGRTGRGLLGPESGWP